MPTDQVILEMRDICKTYPGVRALDKVSLSVRAGTVHALVGENGAGKSTLMKILCGAEKPDAGIILFKNKELHLKSVADGLNSGIVMIRQELDPVRNMTVSENIFLGQELRNRAGLLATKKMEQQVGELLSRMQINIAPTKSMAELSIADCQHVEIAKALHCNASLIIMDEPTSSLSLNETETLFQQIQFLKKQGTAIIYISHRMEEIFQIADEITVLRDGSLIDSGSTASYSYASLIHKMVGRDINESEHLPSHTIGDVIFKAENLTRQGVFDNISFTLREGEVLGFSGLVGAGRSEVFRSVFGLDPLDSGSIYINDNHVHIRHPADAIRAGISMLTEDRRAEGIFPNCSTKENITIAAMRERFSRFGIINSDSENTAADNAIKAMNIKTAGNNQPARELSGGNQQKVLLSKWMLLSPKVLILDEPTRGIDVSAKQEIYALIGEIAQKGCSVILISSELPEILRCCDRIVVMHEGRITGSVDGVDANQNLLMEMATA